MVSVACVGGDGSSWSKCRMTHRQQLLHWVDMGRNFLDWLVDDKRRLNLQSSFVAPLPALDLGDDHHHGIQPEPVSLPQMQASPVTKEDLGRATWTLLHTMAAQYPDKPTRQQQKDVRELMGIVSRMYPCRECAEHFSEVLKSNPVRASSGVDLSQWMCRVHNIVNRSLGKTQFPCQRVDARWGALHCDGACDVHGRVNTK